MSRKVLLTEQHTRLHTMGKRKLHNKCYYSCDWTGYAMGSPNAYMPIFKNGKMTKKGSYCNFESVVAHARELVKQGAMTAEQAYEVNQHVLEMTGGVAIPPSEELHYGNLDHFGGELSMHAFACKSVALHPITGVKVSPKGVYEVILSPEKEDTATAREMYNNHGVERMHYPMENYLTTPYMLPRSEGHPHAFLTKEIQKRPKLKQRDVVFFYHIQPNGLPHNAAASKIMKRDICGDLLIVAKTREPNLFNEMRLVNFTGQMYDDVFEKKKRPAKPVAPSAGICSDEWNELQGELQNSLTDFEASVSKDAEQPGTLAKGAVMPPATGKELAVVAELRGFTRPTVESRC